MFNINELLLAPGFIMKLYLAIVSSFRISHVVIVTSKSDFVLNVLVLS